MQYSKEREKKLQDFCKRFNLLLNNKKNLNIALTHSSYSSDNYERLEFLGDCVLRMVISKYLFEKYFSYDEGKLTKIRAEIVSDKTLSLFAKKINLWDLILTDCPNKISEKARKTILACTFEAILGAIFLEFDTKSFEIISNFIFSNFKEEIEKIEQEIDFLNPKAILQEYSQGKLHILPCYTLLEEKGAEHNKLFTYQVSLRDKKFKSATGTSKKEAQKNAAYNALIELKIIDEDTKQ